MTGFSLFDASQKTQLDEMGRRKNFKPTGGDQKLQAALQIANALNQGSEGSGSSSAPSDPTSGILSGAATGAGIGSMVAPGVGTAVGAAAGGVIGGIAGVAGARKARRKAEGDAQAEKHESLANIEGQKADRINNAMARLGAALSQSLLRR